MPEKLLLLHGQKSGSCGCQKNLGGSTMAYTKRYNRATGRYSKRRSRPRMFMGDLGLTREGLEASFNSVKGVLITGLISAGSAVVTRKLFDAYGSKLGLTKGSIEESLAIGAVGIGGGIMISKFLKQPDIGAAFAIGTLVIAGMNILSNVLGTTQGLGYIVAEKPGFHAGKMAALGMGAQRVEEPGFHPQVVPQAAGYVNY